MEMSIDPLEEEMKLLEVKEEIKEECKEHFDLPKRANIGKEEEFWNPLFWKFYQNYKGVKHNWCVLCPVCPSKKTNLGIKVKISKFPDHVNDMHGSVVYEKMNSEEGALGCGVCGDSKVILTKIEMHMKCLESQNDKDTQLGINISKDISLSQEWDNRRKLKKVKASNKEGGKLKKKLGITCDICNISVKDQFTFNFHLEGELHKKKTVIQEAIIDPEEVSKDRFEWKCEICTVTSLSEVQFEAHTRGARHKKALKVAKEAKFSCSLCDARMDNDYTMQMHLVGAKHRKKLESMEKGGDSVIKPENGAIVQVKSKTTTDKKTLKVVKQATFICSLCNVQMNAESTMQMHLVGAKHRKKLEIMEKGGDSVIKHENGATVQVKSKTTTDKPKGKNSINSDSDEEMKMVLVVRQDLNMGKQKAADEMCNATLAANKLAQQNCPRALRAWEANGQPKVILKADNEEVLLTVLAQAREADLVSAVVSHSGTEQIAQGTKTVVALGPGPVDLLDQVTADLELY